MDIFAQFSIKSQQKCFWVFNWDFFPNFRHIWKYENDWNILTLLHFCMVGAVGNYHHLLPPPRNIIHKKKKKWWWFSNFKSFLVIIFSLPLSFRCGLGSFIYLSFTDASQIYLYCVYFNEKYYYIILLSFKIRINRFINNKTVYNHQFYN